MPNDCKFVDTIAEKLMTMSRNNQIHVMLFDGVLVEISRAHAMFLALHHAAIENRLRL
jgi:hypothetical protein